mmetsp:Transcript_27646/g.81272  ORF Transcript_27646/g.81272 Transcript_27646/m.81272 type:complete len:242 (-) Transcript_27646:1066-1791(-)
MASSASERNRSRSSSRAAHFDFESSIFRTRDSLSFSCDARTSLTSESLLVRASSRDSRNADVSARSAAINSLSLFRRAINLPPDLLALALLSKALFRLLSLLVVCVIKCSNRSLSLSCDSINSAPSDSNSDRARSNDSLSAAASSDSPSSASRSLSRDETTACAPASDRSDASRSDSYRDDASDIMRLKALSSSSLARARRCASDADSERASSDDRWRASAAAAEIRSVATSSSFVLSAEI